MTIMLPNGLSSLGVLVPMLTINGTINSLISSLLLAVYLFSCYRY
jgi:hypothetical protein